MSVDQELEASMTRYINYEGIVDQRPDYFGQPCSIVKTVHNSEFSDDDTYVVRFADDYQLEVFPEELDPIPTAGLEASG